MQRLFIDPSIDAHWRGHQREWKHCQRCPIAKIRNQVCLFRGDLPCEVLFLGEAPGESEDLLGFPFVGPAGKLYDELVKDAYTRADYLPTMGTSNIVACFPNNDREIRKPTDQEATACRPRLEELIKLCNPKLIVTLGQIAKKHLPTVSVPIINLTHPSAFLRHPNGDMLGRKKFVLALTSQFRMLRLNSLEPLHAQ